MNSALSRADIERVIRVLRGHGIAYALLFGSSARDALAFDSDIDVAVSAAGRLTGEQRYRLIGELASVTGRPIDLIDLKTARGALFAHALRGRELFCDSVRVKGETLYRRVSLVEEDLEYSRRTFAMAQPRMFQ